MRVSMQFVHILEICNKTKSGFQFGENHSIVKEKTQWSHTELKFQLQLQQNGNVKHFIGQSSLAVSSNFIYKSSSCVDLTNEMWKWKKKNIFLWYFVIVHIKPNIYWYIFQLSCCNVALQQKREKGPEVENKWKNTAALILQHKHMHWI